MSERTDDPDDKLLKEFGDPAPSSTPSVPSVPSTPSTPAPASGDQGGQPPQGQPPQAPLSYDELQQRYENLRSALHESRGESKETKTRLRNMEETMQALLVERTRQSQPKPPDPQENPLGYYDYRLDQQGKELSELKQKNEAISQQQQTRAEFETFMRGAVAEEVDYATRTPDYYQAASHLENARRLELGIIYPDNDATYGQAREAGFPTIQAFREAILNQDRIAVARQARSLGVNAGEYYYKLAAARGYQKSASQQPGQQPNGQAGQAQPARAGDGKFEKMQKGMAAASSLSSGSGAPNDAPDNDTIEQLAQMYLEDPKEADKMFTRLKKAGKLG